MNKQFRIILLAAVVGLWSFGLCSESYGQWFSGGAPSTPLVITDSTSTTSSTTAASATAVKTAYDLANAAMPKAGGTMAGPISLGTSYLSTTKTVGATGTTANYLATIEAATGKVNTAPVAATGVLGIAVTTRAGGSDLATEVVTRGVGSCVMDTGSYSVIGNIAVVGTTVAGTCKDSGQTDSTLIPDNVQVLGKFLTVAAPTVAASIQFYGPGHYGAMHDVKFANHTGSDAIPASQLYGQVLTLTGSSLTQTVAASVSGMSFTAQTASSNSTSQCVKPATGEYMVLNSPTALAVNHKICSGITAYERVYCECNVAGTWVCFTMSGVWADGGT